MKRVYIAGALNANNGADHLKNIHRMIMWAEEVRKLGFSVFIPAIDYVCGVVHGNWEYKDYFENSQPWLDAADALFVCPGWEESKGTKKEIERATKQNIPVYHTLAALNDGLGDKQ